MKKIDKLIKIFLLVFFLLSFNLRVYAQSSNGSARKTSPSPTTVDAGNSSVSAPVPTPTPITTPKSLTVTKPSTPKNTTTQAAPVLPVVTDTTLPMPPASNSLTIILIISATLALVLGTFGLQVKKNMENKKKENPKCLNIKKLIEAQLEDLTDLKSQLAYLATEKGIEKIVGLAEGTSAEKLTNLIAKGESKYEQLRELYDKCITEFDSLNYKGVIIEESLVSKEVLGKIKIITTKIEQATEKHKTPWLKQWTLHNIEVKERGAEKIAEQISKNLDQHNSWYADFKNKNYHFIIYRRKVFKVDLKNPVLYKDAKKYGISLGIPEYQVDFHPEVKEWKR